MKERPPLNTENNDKFYDIDEQINNSEIKETKITNARTETDKSTPIQEEGEQTNQVKMLQEELKKQKEKAEKNKDRYLRALADYENLEKRTKKERSRLLQNANENLLMKFLELADTLEKAKSSFLNSTIVSDELKEGFLAIERQFSSILTNEGVEKLESLGNIFDPAFHEAVFVRTDSGEGEDTILEVVQTGYKLNDTLLRPSKVIIAK